MFGKQQLKIAPNKIIGCRFKINLLNMKPIICEAWDYSKNSQGPENYSISSGEEV
jgi:hypothetical protein